MLLVMKRRKRQRKKNREILQRRQSTNQTLREKHKLHNNTKTIIFWTKIYTRLGEHTHKTHPTIKGGHISGRTHTLVVRHVGV